MFRTVACVDAGHPEFTVIFEDEPPTRNSVGWVLDRFESAVAAGARFSAGQAVRIGWRTLRVVERGDGTLGLEERVGEDEWLEHVDRALGDLWLQAEAAAKLGLPEELDSVAEDDIAAVQTRALDAAELIFYRAGPGSPKHGGWAVSCGDQHDHAEWSFMELSRLSAALPFVTQFLALPPETGLLIDRHHADRDGRVVADVVLNDTLLTPEGGAYFGPPPARVSALAQKAHAAIGVFGEEFYRTMNGERYGHPDIVARITAPPVPSVREPLVEWILDALQDSIAAGTRFSPGQTVRVGWRTLRVVERDDGMLGLQERVSAGRWEEHVELTLRDLWCQKEVAASLGLTKRLAFPGDDQNVAVADCVDETMLSVLLSRVETDDPRSSGWAISCPRDHDHGRRSSQTLWEISQSLPFATQFFALPVATSVIIEAPHTTATGRIGVRVLSDGRLRVPEPGSYLATLNARG